LRAQILLWEKEYATELLESGEADAAAAAHFLEILNEHSHNIDAHDMRCFFKRIAWSVKHRIESHHKISTLPSRDNYRGVLALNAQHIREKLREIKNEENAGVVEKLDVEFELISAERKNENLAVFDCRGSVEDSVFHAVIAQGFAIEREIIQEMFEENRISRDAAKKMRSLLDMLETQLHSDFK
jgi:CPA1 family monovalent cation:H+ antiporter